MDKPQLNIIKVSGSILNNAADSENFLTDFADLPGLKLLVHGGGDQANHWLDRLGIPITKIEGRRITDYKTMEVIALIYSGLNKQIVAQLNAKKNKAIGICGADLGIIRSHKRKVVKIDYGFAGDIDQVDHLALEQLLTIGFVPVLSPLTWQSDGLLLNTNADTIATQVAIAMSEQYSVSLQYISNVPGVLENVSNPDSVISHINPTSYAKLKSSGIISAGMVPKLDNAVQGLQNGIWQITISNQISSQKQILGTKITL